MIDEDTGVEVGRDAEEALPDYPSSAMPWNVSASLHSHQRGASSSAKGPGFGSQLRGSARRHPSASPLIGRGSNLPGDLERFNQSQDNAPVMFGRDDEEDDDVILRRGASRVPMSGSQTAQEFELYGPAAAVDTQTAGASQWVREALDKESNNFLEFVRNTINEKTADELVDEEEEKFVTFEELFNPDKNSRIVAAQAFHHVLTMATKNKIWVEQDVGSDEPDLMEAFGEMRIGVKDY
ncbi:hypothetical protein B7494_g1836 [Chlorociboria aeruginascens]|nr:hypothetical protein B7494_g1836 [Chlorociboria aeruginascens]